MCNYLQFSQNKKPVPAGFTLIQIHLNLVETEKSSDIINLVLKHPSQFTAHLLGPLTGTK
jgi:hypothetical protein